MGIRDYHIQENTKEMLLSLNVKNFSDVGYWIRDIKNKLKKFDILKIKITLNIKYFDDEE